MRVTLSLLLTSTAAALPTANYGGNKPHQYSKAAYLLDNNPNGSSILALGIGSDGALTAPVRTATYGRGSFTIGADGNPVARDSLQSSGSVFVSDNLLFTVNSGSDTVSLFRIDPRNPLKPQLVGRPASSRGDFPLSVAYSDKLGLACVLNGGKKAGVACFKVDPWRGLQEQGPFLPLGAALNETTPPTGPPMSASEIHFSPEQDTVIATTKGNPATAQPGYLVSWLIKDCDNINPKPKVNVFPSLPLAFGGFFVNQSSFFISDPSFGAAFLKYSDNGAFAESLAVNITGQKAACWVAYDPSEHTAYAIDAGQPIIYGVDTRTGTLNGQLTGSATDMGFFDSSVIDHKLYALAANNGISVFDLPSRKETQFFDLTAFGVQRAGLTGLVTWNGRQERYGGVGSAA